MRQGSTCLRKAGLIQRRKEQGMRGRERKRQRERKREKERNRGRERERESKGSSESARYLAEPHRSLSRSSSHPRESERARANPHRAALDLTQQVPWPLELRGRLHSRHATVTRRSSARLISFHGRGHRRAESSLDFVIGRTGSVPLRILTSSNFSHLKPVILNRFKSVERIHTIENPVIKCQFQGKR